MNKTQLIDQVASIGGMKKKGAAVAVEATLEAIVICAMYKNKTFYKLMKGISDDLH